MEQSMRLTRREAVAGAAVAGLAWAAPAHAQTATATATGRVSAEDGRGMAGVMVSNGQEVVRTDADGRYAVGLAPGQCVFVVKPSGYALTVDPATGLQRFAYMHAPDGSPSGFRFPGLVPTGPLPTSIDFALRRVDEPARFDVLLLTDPQPETLAELEYVRRDVIEQTAGIAAAFGITTGDLMFDDLSLYIRYNRMIGAIGLPWHNLPGNHDINVEAADDAHSRDTWKRVFGPRHYAFQYGGATFLMLDNVQYLGADPARPGELAGYRGWFGPGQLAFVRAVLAQVPAEALVVCCFHIPLRTVIGSTPNTAAVDARDFLAAISSHRNSVSLAGHTHTNEHHYLGAADGFTGGGEHHHHVLTAVSGSWWSGPLDPRGIPAAVQIDGAPNGFHLLSIDGAAAGTRLLPAHDPARAQLRLMLDSQAHGERAEVLHEYPPGRLLTGPIDVDAVPATRLVANLFDGGPRSAVQLSIDGGAPLAMQRTVRTDPFVQEVYARNRSTTKPWVRPAPSSHIWQLLLPVGLGAGMHRLAVSATDEHGRSHVAAMVLEVTA